MANLRDTQGIPLIRRPRRGRSRTTASYSPGSIIPGRQHQIEGRENVSLRQRDNPRVDRDLRSNASGGFINPLDAANREHRNIAGQNKAAAADYKSTLAGFSLEDAARRRIKPVLDPEEGKTERRRSAARRRMRGRLGTLLSQRETLGG